MKKSQYILIISLLLSSLITSCVKDYKFGEPDFEQTANVIQNSDGITFSSTIDKESLLGEVTEKGFVIVRKLPTGEQKDTVRLAPDDKFEYTIDDDYWQGLEITVYPYIIDGGHEFRGQTSTVRCILNEKPIHVTGVEIKYDDDSHLTGTIIITGDHLGQYQKDVVWAIDTETGSTTHLGDVNFDVISATNERHEIRYECYNIGEFTIAYINAGRSQRLSKTLDTRTAEIVNWDSNAKMGIPHPLTVMLSGVEQTEVGAYLSNGENDILMSSSDEYDKSGKGKVIFSARPGNYKVIPYFMYKGHETYLPSCQVSISSPWDGGMDMDMSYDLRTTSKSLIWNLWDAGWQNRHSDEYISIQSFNPATGKTAEYSYDYSNYQAPWRTSSETRLVAEDDDVYFSVSLEHVKSSDGYCKCIRVLRISPGNTKVQEFGDVLYDASSGKRNYELFAKVSDIFYFVDDDSKTVMTWDSRTKAIRYITYDYDWADYIGRDSNYFYFLITEHVDYSLKYSVWRTPIANLSSREKLDLDINQHINTINAWGELGEFGSAECVVYNGRIYQSCLMRSTSTTDLTSHRYYGLPDNSCSNYRLCPMGDKVYCTAPWSKLFKSMTSSE